MLQCSSGGPRDIYSEFRMQVPVRGNDGKRLTPTVVLRQDQFQRSDKRRPRQCNRQKRALVLRKRYAL